LASLHLKESNWVIFQIVVNVMPQDVLSKFHDIRSDYMYVLIWENVY